MLPPLPIAHPSYKGCPRAVEKYSKRQELSSLEVGMSFSTSPVLKTQSNTAVTVVTSIF
jgi:hypothetical protein